jgi:Fic family protein
MKRQGTYVNNLSGDMQYQSFQPASLPPTPSIEINNEMSNLTKKSYQILGKLNGVSSLLTNNNLFISMYVRKEALLSSQIEGTQATLDDIFDPNISKNVNTDVEEVLNYLNAIHHAEKLIENLPVSLRFMKRVHKVLLSGRRGEERYPGEFRSTQNWIGAIGSTLRNATFIPPNVTDMNQALGDLEKYIHQEDHLDQLIKIALIHYQFETIHPFLDGNGRIGRLLINVLLKEYKILEYDTLYLSYYLKRNRMEYYDRLSDIRQKGNYEQWIRFFLIGIIESASHALACIDAILRLRNKNMNMILQIKGKQKETAKLLFVYIETHPIIDISQTCESISKSFNTVAKAIELFIDLGILVQIKGQDRYRVFAYNDYLEILRDGTEIEPI